MEKEKCKLASDLLALQDQNDEWKALPYEAAGAVARSLMRHCHTLSELRKSKALLLEKDPQKKKAATQKVCVKVDSMLHVDKYMVFNPRTGQMATEAWLSDHIQVVEGKPEFKRKRKNDIGPKIVTLGIKVLENTVDLTLDLSHGDMGARPIRCFDLRDSKPQGDLQYLSTGFGHLGEDSLEDESDVENWVDFDEVDFEHGSQKDENDFDDEIPQDDLGIEGV